MKKILIIYPHFPPSNLAGVHRPRLFAQHLPSFGWEPTILTVDEKYYEEELDWKLHQLMPVGLRIEKVKAMRVNKPRLIGDIGLRAFLPLYRRAKQLILKESFDFLYIPIPSFYTALLGRLLANSTGIKYGIDYIDPWVHDFPGSEKIFSKAWFSTRLAKILEPIAVKNASLITGVAEGYYAGVLKRNPHLKESVITGAMPYGGEPSDHDMVKELHLQPYLFTKETGVLQMVYAGAMLPKAYEPLKAIFKSILANPKLFGNIEFHFIGTGKTADDSHGYNIKAMASTYGLWQTIVYEYPRRIPYLDVLVHLQNADGIFILGSTESHYTPSKAYQAVLTGKPILAVLHKDSTAVQVIQQSGAGKVLDFDGAEGVRKIEEQFANFYSDYKNFNVAFRSSSVKTNLLNQYSAKEITGTLVKLLEKALLKN